MEAVSGRRPTWATIDLGAIRENFAEVRRRAPGKAVIAVVKADAYGHGAVAVARALADAGCERLAVLSVDEAAVLRQAGIGLPVLLLGGLHEADEAEAAIELQLVPTVHDGGQVELLAKAAARRGSRQPLQIEVDSGMRRMGVTPQEAPACLAAVAEDSHLMLDGLFTHYARADEPDLEPSLAQLREFRGVLGAARQRAIVPASVHAANSAGILAGPALAEALPEADAVRPGIMLFGANPAPHVEVALRPAMTLRSRVVRVCEVAAGEGVGYGATYRPRTRTRIATLPVGYADGVDWRAANRGQVLMRGRRLPIAGRVSMDYVTVDVGDEPIEVGEEAVLFGQAPGGPRLGVEEVAATAGTVSYEVLVRVGARVPRVILE